MTLIKAIHIGIVACVLLWVAFMLMPDTLEWSIPVLWIPTLPLAGWVLAVAARQSACSKPTLWTWAVVLVVLPAVSMAFLISVKLGITWGITIRLFGPIDSLVPLAIMTATAWPVMLIVLFYLLKWTSRRPGDEHARLSQT